MQIHINPFGVELYFMVYDGTDKTLPKEHINIEDNIRQPLLVLLFDSEDIVFGFRDQKRWMLQMPSDKPGITSARISIGDAWALYSTRKDVKHYPMPG